MTNERLARHRAAQARYAASLKGQVTIARNARRRVESGRAAEAQARYARRKAAECDAGQRQALAE